MKTLENPEEVGVEEVGVAETGVGRRAGRDKLFTRRAAWLAPAKFKKWETQEVPGATGTKARKVEKAQIEG